MRLSKFICIRLNTEMPDNTIIVKIRPNYRFKNIRLELTDTHLLSLCRTFS